MKTLFLITALFLAASTAAAQELTFEQSLPTMSITIPQMSGDIYFYGEGGIELFSTKRLEDGQYTLELGPDVTWDEAASGFWKLIDEITWRSGCPSDIDR